MTSYQIFCPEICYMPLLIYQLFCLWENERTIQFRLMAADSFRVYLQVLSIGYKDGIILCATLLEFVLFVVFEFQELNVPLLFFRSFCKLNWVLCSYFAFKDLCCILLEIFAVSYLLLFQHDFLSYILVYARTIYFYYNFFCLVQGKLYSIMEICRIFDQIYKEHLDGVYVFSILFFQKKVLFVFPPFSVFFFFFVFFS